MKDTHINLIIKLPNFMLESKLIYVCDSRYAFNYVTVPSVPSNPLNLVRRSIPLMGILNFPATIKEPNLKMRCFLERKKVQKKREMIWFC